MSSAGDWSVLNLQLLPDLLVEQCRIGDTGLEEAPEMNRRPLRFRARQQLRSCRRAVVIALANGFHGLTSFLPGGGGPRRKFAAFGRYGSDPLTTITWAITTKNH